MAQIINAKDLRSGHTFVYKSNIYLVLENSFNKTAMREGIVKCKVKNLRNLSITIEVLTGQKLEQATILKKKCSFSYIDGNNYIFIDLENFEQYEINKTKIEWEKNFLIEGSEVNILFYENEILGLSIPDQVSLEIEFAEQAVQGNSVQSALKKATLQTGYEINVPQFIKTGEMVIVNTVDGEYVSRAKNV